MEEKIVETKYARFKDSVWFPFVEELGIIIGGAGGTGSNVAYFLSRAGFNILVYDFDTLEEVNMAGQHYPHSYINKPKVEALENVIRDFCQKEVSTINEAYNKGSYTDLIMISCFDNMKSRKLMFEKWKELVEQLEPEDSKKALFIDTRMEAEFFQIYCVRPEDINRYEETLFDDSEISEPICSYKQTSHIGGILGGLVTVYLTNHLRKIFTENAVTSVPFLTEYVAYINYFKYEN